MSLAGGAAGSFYLLGDDVAARTGKGLDIATSPIPEPTSIALAGFMLIGMSVAARKRK